MPVEFLTRSSETVSGLPALPHQVSTLSLEEQRMKLIFEHERCKTQMATDPYLLTDLFCNRTWDNILCWPDTPAGHVARQPCPEYINKFDQGEFVTRSCTDNGTWWINPETHQSWTNYSACEKTSNKFVPQLIQEHMPGIKLMYTIGYSLSLTALTLALIIMIYFKRLHCPRNFIHMNMFLAFGVRAAFSLMKTVLLVNDLGFANDVNLTQPEMKFVEGMNHWECKLFFTFFYYIIFSSVMWLLNEGLYLQLILSISVFSDKTKVRWFVLVGWGIPLLFVIPWVVCRIYLDDMLCWNVHMFRGLYWIIHGPMMASVAINFVIFINTVRMLFTKLRAPNCPDSKMHRYRKLAKSTLILIPLFAVYYMIFMMLPDDVNATVDLIKTYVEMLFNSFQGFLVALLFCFLNHEVQNEMRTKWRRESLQLGGSRGSQPICRPLFRRQSTQRNNQSLDHRDSNLVCKKDSEREIIESFKFTPPENVTNDSKLLMSTCQDGHNGEAAQRLVVTNCPELKISSSESTETINLTTLAGEPLIVLNKSRESFNKTFFTSSTKFDGKSEESNSCAIMPVDDVAEHDDACSFLANE